MNDFEVAERGALQELRLSRALGRAIEEELRKGNDMPDEVKRAYLELFNHWQWQINRELS